MDAPVAAKVVTPKEEPRGVEQGDVDSKRKTPKKTEDVDESKGERGTASPAEAEVCREG
jgi:hypothetical protein